jgi:hypothetical protein
MLSLVFSIFLYPSRLTYQSISGLVLHPKRRKKTGGCSMTTLPAVLTLIHWIYSGRVYLFPEFVWKWRMRNGCTVVCVYSDMFAYWCNIRGTTTLQCPKPCSESFALFVQWLLPETCFTLTSFSFQSPNITNRHTAASELYCWEERKYSSDQSD